MPKELSKETIDMIESELKEFLVTIPLPKDDNMLRLGYEAGRLRGLSEIEKLTKQTDDLIDTIDEKQRIILELESQNKELMEALRFVIFHVDKQFMLSDRYREIESLLKSLPQ